MAGASGDTRSLPPSVAKLFWEYDVDSVFLPEHLDLVIGKVLQVGTWDDVVWLRREVGDQAIREWLLRHEGRGLDVRRLSFWQLILDLPAERVNAWIERVRSDPWERRNDR